MSTRKTTLFYAVLIAVASLAVGMVIASRLDLTPTSSAQTVAMPAMNSAPLGGPIDATTFRNIAKTRSDRRQHPDRVAAAHAGPDRVLRRRRRWRRPAAAILRRRRRRRRRAAGGRDRGRRQSPQGQLTAGRRHRLRHRQGGLHPDEQPRHRGGRQDHRGLRRARRATKNMPRRSSATTR